MHLFTLMDLFVHAHMSCYSHSTANQQASNHPSVVYNRPSVLLHSDICFQFCMNHKTVMSITNMPHATLHSCFSHFPTTIPEKQTTRPTETQVLVTVLGDDLSPAPKLVGELWNARIKAEYSISRRMAKHMERAKSSGIPWLVFVGERELTEKVVNLKNLEAAGKGQDIPRDRLVEELQSSLMAHQIENTLFCEGWRSY